MEDQPAFLHIKVDMKDILCLLVLPPPTLQKRKADSVDISECNVKRSKLSGLLEKRKADDVDINELSNSHSASSSQRTERHAPTGPDKSDERRRRSMLSDPRAPEPVMRGKERKALRA
ncbi:unnamed protein product [Alternaria alternata]